MLPEFEAHEHIGIVEHHVVLQQLLRDPFFCAGALLKKIADGLRREVELIAFGYEIGGAPED